MFGLIIVSAAVVALLAWHVAKLGTYYIRFDGKTYTVWIRRFAGYDDILPTAFRLTSEAEARQKIDEAKKNPPRTITL